MSGHDPQELVAGGAPERLTRGLIPNQLDREEVARAAHVSHEGDVAEPFEPLAEARLVVLHVVDDRVLLEDIEVG